MKKLSSAVLAIIMVASVFLMTACMKEEDYYTKGDVDGFVTNVEFALLKKADEDNAAAIKALTDAYNAKIAGLEGKIEDLEAGHKAELDELRELINSLHNIEPDPEPEPVELYTRNGNKITFGSYPQSKVTDTTLESTLTAKAGTLPTSENAQSWTSYGYYADGEISNYMWYIDVEEGGERYRGVYFTSYRPYWPDNSSSSSNTYQDDNGYNISTVYWFRYDPISWTILNENTTDGTALILCDMIIDSQQYDYENGSYDNNYAESTIRKWLNETFYDTAFNELQKEIIITTTVDNSVESTGYSTNKYVCEDTNDKIFLLSYAEVTNSSYGFSSDYSDYDTARQKKTTDYAQSQGAYTNTGSYAGNGWWWLRSPYNYDSGSARGVFDDGGISSYRVNYTSRGVVPALQIWLS